MMGGWIEGKAGPRTEVPVQGGDAGELQEPGLSG